MILCVHVQSEMDGSDCANTGESCSVFSFFHNKHKPTCDGAEARYRRCRGQTGARGSVLTDIDLGTKPLRGVEALSSVGTVWGRRLHPPRCTGHSHYPTRKIEAPLYHSSGHIRRRSSNFPRAHVANTCRNYVAFVSEAMWDENWLHKVAQRV